MKAIVAITCLISLFACASAGGTEPPPGDSRGDDWTQWINIEGQKVWGAPPEPCDDWTFARRVYLDVLGRPPSVAELRDYELGDAQRRRAQLVDQLVFAEGPEQAAIVRQAARQFARQWRAVLLPNVRDVAMAGSTLDAWLVKEYRDRVPLNELMRRLIVSNFSAGQSATGAPTSDGAALDYYTQLGSLPENYAVIFHA